MANITIGEVARRTGLRASAIRYYEKIGLLPKTQRISGRRRYEPGVFNSWQSSMWPSERGSELTRCGTFSTDSAEGSQHSTAGKSSRNAR